MTTVNVTTTSNTVTVTENGSSTVVQTPVTSTVTATAVGPQGATGATGATGSAATIAVGTVTTGAAGSNATVTNSGSSSAAVFDFAIPQGATGATGPAGADGADGANGGTDIVLDTTPQLGGDLDSNGNNINFADGDRLRFGADADLQIFHTGTTSKIRDGGTGNLVIEGNEVYIINVLNGEVMARFTPDGAAELHYDNSKKFETTSTGVEVTGTVVADGVTVGDDERLKLGASDDLQIWHTGSNSVIQDSGTGNLFIQGSSSVKITDTSANEMAVFVDGGAAELYYDNAKKIETTSTGATITGTCVATEFSGSGASLTGVTKTDTTGITGASAVNNIVAISQADYDAISSPDANTIYYITS